MSDLRTSFCILEDASSQVGMPLHKVLEGDTPAAKNALAALVAKDSDGKLVYMKTDANGVLLVNTEGEDVAELFADGTHTGHKTIYQTLAEITLTTSKDYKNAHVWLSCFRDTIFQIIQTNGITETVLVSGLRVGAGMVSWAGIMKQLNFSTGASGVQKLTVKGINLESVSTMNATIGIDEIVPIV